MLLLLMRIMLLMLLRIMSLLLLRISRDQTAISTTPGDLVVALTQLIQKLLDVTYYPTKWIGAAVEFILNFIALNGGLLGIIWNIITRKLVVPLNRDAPNFSRIVGLVDGRTELQVESSEQQHLLEVTVMAAKIAYENAAYIENVVSNVWKFNFVGYYNCWNSPGDEVFTLELHHGGFLCGVGNNRTYIYGRVDFFDNCVCETWSMLWMEEFLDLVGIKLRGSAVALYWCLAGISTRVALRALKKDIDLVDMITASESTKTLEVYVDHVNLLATQKVDDVQQFGQRETQEVTSGPKRTT